MTKDEEIHRLTALVEELKAHVNQLQGENSSLTFRCQQLTELCQGFYHKSSTFPGR